MSPKKRPARRKKRKTDDVGNVSSEDVAVGVVGEVGEVMQ